MIGLAPVDWRDYETGLKILAANCENIRLKVHTLEGKICRREEERTDLLQGFALGEEGGEDLPKRLGALNAEVWRLEAEHRDCSEALSMAEGLLKEQRKRA